jgi:hypothetical protein
VSGKGSLTVATRYTTSRHRKTREGTQKMTEETKKDEPTEETKKKKVEDEGEDIKKIHESEPI